MGLSVGSVLFYRYAFAALLLGLLMCVRGDSFRLSLRQVLLMVIQGILFASSSPGLFKAYNYMDVGLASTMLFVEPVIIALILWIFYRQRVSVPTCIAMWWLLRRRAHSQSGCRVVCDSTGYFL